MPKGAMLPHSAMSSTTYGVSRGLFEYNIRACDTNISYLPASHVFERALQVNEGCPLRPVLLYNNPYAWPPRSGALL